MILKTRINCPFSAKLNLKTSRDNLTGVDVNDSIVVSLRELALLYHYRTEVRLTSYRFE